MAPVFPLAMPAHPIQADEFKLVFGVSMNQYLGNATQIVEKTDPRWMCTLTTDDLATTSTQDRIEIAAWMAFWANLEGYRTFLAHDPAQAYPANYPQGQGLSGWNGIGGFSVTSVYTCTFTSLSPSTIELKAGDMVSLVQSGRYSLHVLSEDRTASSGTISTCYVRPAIDTSRFSSGVAYWIKPQVEMLPIPGSFKAPKAETPQAISFQGIQKPW